MKNYIYIFFYLSITTVNAFSQGYYFNIDKEQYWDEENVSEKGLCNVKLTYVFDWGNNKIIERNDDNGEFRIFDVDGYDKDTINEKEIWFYKIPGNDSMLVLIDFSDMDNHNIILCYFTYNLNPPKKLWQHVLHYKIYTKEEVKEFVDKLYK